jgi:hypothetical protein
MSRSRKSEQRDEVMAVGLSQAIDVSRPHSAGAEQARSSPGESGLAQAYDQAIGEQA